MQKPTHRKQTLQHNNESKQQLANKQKTSTSIQNPKGNKQQTPNN